MAAQQLRAQWSALTALERIEKGLKGVGVICAALYAAHLWLAGYTSLPTRVGSLESTRDLHAQQITALQQHDERQAVGDSLQNSTLEFLKCARLSDLGLEDRTPKECARDYLARR